MVEGWSQHVSIRCCSRTADLHLALHCEASIVLPAPCDMIPIVLVAHQLSKYATGSMIAVMIHARLFRLLQLIADWIDMLTATATSCTAVRCSCCRVTAVCICCAVSQTCSGSMREDAGILRCTVKCIGTYGAVPPLTVPMCDSSRLYRHYMTHLSYCHHLQQRLHLAE